MSENEMLKAELPDEVIRDILSRLPVKSLLQFRSVSKHWRGLIADTHFVKSHLKKVLALSSHHQILVPASPLMSLSYNASPDDINASIELDSPFLKPRTSIKILGSCNGLVCLIDGTRDVIIYNPSTRRHFKPYQLPQQVLPCSNRIEFVYGFGCGSNPNDMRVVRFPRFARDSEYIKSMVCGVASGSPVSGVVAYNYDFIDTVGTFLNGSLHWLAHHSNNDNENRAIASFNISEETFGDLSLPPQEGSLPYYNLGVLQGCLSALCDDMYYTDVEVWLMKEYGVVNSWTKFIKVPLNTGIENISYMMPLSSLNDDEILLEIDLRSFVIYNVKKKTFRHVTTTHDLKWFGDAAIYVESLLSPEVLCVLY
ncbi:hypothetical protein L6452_05619 [Arctium lappa]|uniref:Uncharacterized protein n=1 Tax=Arctium lappa TaxID=4217 RepID=A0ACB9EGY6_ARCLA|nr:hypothetical protein L6452_05619 [Arctium lappa]